jgi:hypothetical protein
MKPGFAVSWNAIFLDSTNIIGPSKTSILTKFNFPYTAPQLVGIANEQKLACCYHFKYFTLKIRGLG